MNQGETFNNNSGSYHHHRIAFTISTRVKTLNASENEQIWKTQENTYTVTSQVILSAIF